MRLAATGRLYLAGALLWTWLWGGMGHARGGTLCPDDPEFMAAAKANGVYPTGRAIVDTSGDFPTLKAGTTTILGIIRDDVAVFAFTSINNADGFRSSGSRPFALLSPGAVKLGVG